MYEYWSISHLTSFCLLFYIVLCDISSYSNLFIKNSVDFWICSRLFVIFIKNSIDFWICSRIFVIFRRKFCRFLNFYAIFLKNWGHCWWMVKNRGQNTILDLGGTTALLPPWLRPCHWKILRASLLSTWLRINSIGFAFCLWSQHFLLVLFSLLFF